MYRRKPKAFEMARSILPSTSRKGARDDKRNFHKRQRAKVREILETIDDFDDEGNLVSCETPRQAGFYWDVVEGRRGSDKLNHFVKWAERITDHLPQEEKMDFIRPMLPDGLIGEHARSHLYKLEPDYPRWHRWMSRGEPEPLLPILEEANGRIEAYNTGITEALTALESDPKAKAKFNHNYYQWCLSQARARANEASGWKYDRNTDARWYEICEPIVNNYVEFVHFDNKWKNMMTIGKFWKRDYSRFDYVSREMVELTVHQINRMVKNVGSPFTRFLANYFKVEHP